MTPNRLTTGLAAIAACCIVLSSCKSTNTVADNDVVDYTPRGSTSSPAKLSEEYPFDESGNYREDIVARGVGVSGVKDKPVDTALYSQTDSTSNRSPINHPAYTPDDTPARTFTSNSQSSGGGSGSASSGVKKSSPSSSSSTNRTASNRSSGSSSKPKPKSTASKPKPKPSTVVKVKSSDTLYGLSRKYGVSVDSIKKANGLKGDTIVDGKSLKIPRKK